MTRFHVQPVPLDSITSGLVGGAALGGFGVGGLGVSFSARALSWCKNLNASSSQIPPFLGGFPLNHHMPSPCPDPLFPGPLGCFQVLQGPRRSPLS